MIRMISGGKLKFEFIDQSNSFPQRPRAVGRAQRSTSQLRRFALRSQYRTFASTSSIYNFWVFFFLAFSTYEFSYRTTIARIGTGGALFIMCPHRCSGISYFQIARYNYAGFMLARLQTVSKAVGETTYGAAV